MDIINVNALPIIPLDERLVVSANVRTVLEDALRKRMQGSPPICLSACIIGSMSQVNQRIMEVELGSSLMISTLAIEDYELEKKSLREKTHGSPGDKVKKQKEEPPISCQGSELRNARVLPTKRKTADKNLLAELHEHPPFDEMKPNKLPNGVDFCDMVGNVIRSEKNPLSGKSYCSDRELEKFLCSPFLAAMWLDSFWWLFHERYQPDKEIQKKLFDRIARNYASLLFKMCRSHYEEALLKSYNNWDYSELDPERFRQEELMLQSSRLLKAREFTLFTCKKSSIQQIEQKHTKFHNLVGLLKASHSKVMKEKELSNKTTEESYRCRGMKDQNIPTLLSRKATKQVKQISHVRACMDTFVKTSHPACKSPELTSNQFNLYGRSPLMTYFFLNYSQLQLTGQDLLVSRREKTEIIPDSAMTYADIIQLVTKNMEIRKKKLRQLDQMHENEWNCFNNYLTELQENFERELEIINKKEREKRKDKNRVVSSTSLFESSGKKSKGNKQRETAFLSRKKKKEVEERPKGFYSPFSFQNSMDVDNNSLGLKSPYRIKSPSSEGSSSISTIKQDMLFQLSPSSME
ncbi:protein FAM227A isoform X3 [Mus musculus]|uniref:protein FAM227A isoform X3 n=1 Tax=Mus musculus TaxID=10090 RepID=UPI0007ECD0F6|nr:protein FAM227A isoform X3 [Mus musculus]|eukprot:XP_017172267.1 PREDICTED: protein FAM227A isoform X3 [Mus musculus]